MLVPYNTMHHQKNVVRCPSKQYTPLRIVVMALGYSTSRLTTKMLLMILHEDAKVADQMLAQQRVAFQAI